MLKQKMVDVRVCADNPSFQAGPWCKSRKMLFKKGSEPTAVCIQCKAWCKARKSRNK